MRNATCWIAVLCALVAGTTAAAQSPAPDARLSVLVTDPTGGVIVGAVVTLTVSDGARVGEVKTTSSGPDGQARFDGLVPGRYAVDVSFEGFESTHVRDVRVRAGENGRTVRLPIRRVAEDVSVGQEAEDLALDPRGDAFSTLLTREQIAMLPDDPAELEAVLRAMSPPGAVIRVDGFTGGRLPSKSQIRSIRLPRLDEFAAQNHGSIDGMMFIDIATQPGLGAMGGSVTMAWRGDALNARDPFSPVKGDEGLRRGGVTVGGPIAPGRSSFSLYATTDRTWTASTLFAALPGGTTAGVSAERDRLTEIGGAFDQAFAGDHAFRASANLMRRRRSNLGVGAYDLTERAYGAALAEGTVRLSESGTIGRRAFVESRLQTIWRMTSSEAVLEAPTIRVLDAFTAGGAQRAGGRRSLDVQGAVDVDYVRGRHSARVGLLVDTGRSRTDERENYLGTFTFSSLADYERGRPSLYTRRAGDPLVGYRNTQVGLYAQDDYRVARSLLVSYGVRYEGQSLARDWRNLSPRGTVTWAPGRNGRTTLRAGAGWFTNWLSPSDYELSAIVNGSRQQEVMIASPGYPDPGEAGVTLPSTRYAMAEDYRLPKSWSWNVGIDRTFRGTFRLGVTYTERGASGLLRGVNRNAAVDGVRPDPRDRDVIEAVGDAAHRARLVNVSTGVMLPEWHRTFIGGNYTLASVETNTTGAFRLPATGDPAGEWGPSMPRHRAGATFTTRITSALSLNLTMRAQSGQPYTVTTGTDANGDGQFNDRPAGVGRNSARGAAMWDLGGRLSYAIGFGGPARVGAGGTDERIVIRGGGGGGGGGLAGGFDGGADNSRLRLEFYVAAQNITNHRNDTGYSGVVTSPFFGQPTAVMNPRKVELGMRLGF